MSVEGLEHYSKDELIEELINRQTFAGVVIYSRGDAKAGRLEPGEVVITKSPPLSQQGVEWLIETGRPLVAGMFGEKSPDAAGIPSQGLVLRVDPLPLRVDENGVIRVGGSRVTIDLIVEQYENGMTPEEMVSAYDALALADVYGVISYYMNHRDEVQDYLKRRHEQAADQRDRMETGRRPITRQELVARRDAEVKNHAPAGQ
jgi:uncharacterized protein (DUF433 family)